jgi:hypothetical protein
MKQIAHYLITAALAFSFGIAGALAVAILQFGLLTGVAAEWAAAIATLGAVIVALLAPRIERRAQLRRAQQEDIRALYYLIASVGEPLHRATETMAAGQWSEDAILSFLPLLLLHRDLSRKLEIRSLPQGDVGHLIYTLRATIEIAAALAQKAAAALPSQIDPEPMDLVFADFATLAVPMGKLADRYGMKHELKIIGDDRLGP